MSPFLTSCVLTLCLTAGPVSAPGLHLVEDHSQAVGLWMAKGIRGMRVLHVDAHLDIGPSLRPQDLSEIRTLAQEGDFSQLDRRSRYLAEAPLIGINNFVNAAHELGILSEVVWVQRLKGAFTTADLEAYKSFLRLFRYFPDRDIESFRLEGPFIRGRLQGVPVTVCTLQSLPKMEGPALLDVDVDFFVNQGDGLSPSSVLDSLSETLKILKAHPLAYPVATVAFSVNGGHTPTLFRFIGNVLAESMAGRAERTEMWSYHRQALEKLGYSDLYGGLDLLEKEEKLAGRQPWISYLRSRFSRRLNDVKRSMDHMREAFGQDPSYISGFLEDAQASLEGGDLDGAAALAEAGLDLVPGFPPLLDVLGSAAFNGGQFERALELYGKVAAVRPDTPLIHGYMGDTLLRLGRTGDAITHYEEAVRLHKEVDDSILPDHFYLALSDLYEGTGRRGDALDLLKGLAGLNPRTTPSTAVLGRMDRLLSMDDGDTGSDQSDR